MEGIFRWMLIACSLCAMTTKCDAALDLSRFSLNHMTLFEMIKAFAAEHPAATETVVRKMTDRLGPEGLTLRQELMSKLYVDTYAAPYEESEDCSFCQILFRIVKLVARIDGEQEWLSSADEICRILGNSIDQSIQVHILCPGVISIQGPHVYKIITNPTTFPVPFCEMLNACYNTTTSIVPGWPSQSTTSSKQSAAASASQASKRSNESKRRVLNNRRSSKAGGFTIAQLTDVHLEPDYKQGTQEVCGLPVCCQDIYGTGKAGHYGHYNCNIPKKTVELFMQKINDLAPSFIVFSGDIPPHTMWEETASSQLNCTQELVSVIAAKIPRTTRVLPSIGNHEMYPTNLFSIQHCNETSPLLSKIVDTWTNVSKFSEQEVASMKTDGFYSTVLDRSVVNDVVVVSRLIALSSVYMYSANFYNVWNTMIIDVVPPGTISVSSETNAYKQRLETQLEDSRRAGEKVILMGHHVLGNSDYAVKDARWYEELVNKYRDIIVLQMAGHTHNDEFRLFSSESDLNNVTSVQHVCPSMDSHGYTNPSVRLYEFDDNWNLIDYTQYFFNLSAIAFNDSTEPTITKLYSAKEAYGLADLKPASWLDLLNRMASDQTLLEKHRSFTSAGASSSGSFTCTGTCRLEYLCQMRYASYDRYQACIHQYDEPTTTVTTTGRPTLPVLTGQPALDPVTGAAQSNSLQLSGLMLLMLAGTISHLLVARF